MENKRAAEDGSPSEPPAKQMRLDNITTEPPPGYPEPSDLDMLDDGRVAVFQREQLWAKVMDLNAELSASRGENTQLQEHIASLSHVPQAAVYELTAVQEDLALTLKRAGITAPANVEESPVSAAILDPEVNALDLFSKMDAPLKPIKGLLSQIVYALEEKSSSPDTKDVDEAMADLHARMRKASDTLEEYSAREKKIESSLKSTQFDLEDARQNLETMRKHIVTLQLGQTQAEQEKGMQQAEAGQEDMANGPDGEGKESKSQKDVDKKDCGDAKVETKEKPDPELRAEIDKLRKLADKRLEEIKAQVEKIKKLRSDYDRLHEEAEIREGGVVEMKEVLGSALYQTMEVTLQQLYLKEQRWEKERQDQEESLKEKQKAFEEEMKEVKQDYEERLKAMKKEVEDMRVEKEKAKAEKDKWSMTYEARKLEQGKGRVITALEARVERAEKLRDKANEENRSLKDQVSDLQKRLTTAQKRIESNSKIDKDAVIEELRSELNGERTKSDAFMGEIEATSALFADVEAENGRLTKLLAEKELTLSRVMGERLKHRQALTTVKEENKTMLGKLAVEVDKAKALNIVLTATRKEVADAKLLAQEAGEECQVLAMQAEKRKSICDDLAVTSRTAKAEKDELKRQLEAIRGRATSAGAEAEDARFELKRVQEELDATSEKLAHLENERDKRVEMMNGDEVKDELIRELRRRLNCSVVTTQPKQVVLLRCGHLFSRQCVDELVAGRNRKCPMCGERFGQDDVRPVFFT